MHQAVEEGAAVVAEGGAGVGVGAELVAGSLNLVRVKIEVTLHQS